jgi:trigger factor
MQVTVENTGPNTKLLKVQIPAPRVKIAFDKFYASVAPKVKIPGFRPGKVPRHVLEQKLEGNAREEVLQKIVPDVIKEIAADKKLQPVIPPLLTKIDWRLDTSLYFEAQMDLVPVVKLPKYRKIPVQVKKQVLDEGEVQKSLEHLRERHGQLSPVTDRGLKAGDVAIVDQKVTVEDKVLEENKDLTLDLSEGKTGPEMIKGMLDAKIGDVREISMKVPDHYPKKELVGKAATISARVKEVKEKKVPELNDDFAKMVGETQTLAELKGKIRESLEKYQKDMIRSQQESQVHEYLLKYTKMDLSERLVESQKQHLHKTAEERKQAPEKPDEVYWQGLTKQAQQQLKLHFIYTKIVAEEKIAPSDAEVDKKLEEIAGQIGQGVAMIKEYYKKENRMEELRDRLSREAAMDVLLSQAKIKEIR